MFTREQANHNSDNPHTREKDKRILKWKGWSQRAAAEQLGITYQHLSAVLNGHRQSKSLIRRIHQLPNNPQK